MEPAFIRRESPCFWRTWLKLCKKEKEFIPLFQGRNYYCCYNDDLSFRDNLELEKRGLERKKQTHILVLITFSANTISQSGFQPLCTRANIIEWVDRFTVILCRYFTSLVGCLTSKAFVSLRLSCNSKIPRSTCHPLEISGVSHFKIVIWYFIFRPTISSSINWVTTYETVSL